VTDSFKSNLVIVHSPGAQDISDWIAVKEKIDARAPDIDVRIVRNGRPNPEIAEWQLSRPSLVFSPCNLVNYRPAGGKIYVGDDMDKLEQIRRLDFAGIPVPRSVVLIPGLSLDPAAWGEYVLVKPASKISSYGRSIKLARPETVGARFEELTARGQEKMLVQQLIDATDEAGRLVAYRALTMFERPLFVYRSRQVKPRPPLAVIHDWGSNIIAHNTAAKGVKREREMVEEADVLDLAARAARAVREFPVLGLDIIRERSTGGLYVLETNSGGNVWHLSSSLGLRYPHKQRRKLYNQFGALDVAADALIEKTRQEASWLGAGSVAGSSPARGAPA
jgi:hypothetical protein